MRESLPFTRGTLKSRSDLPDAMYGRISYVVPKTSAASVVVQWNWYKLLIAIYGIVRAPSGWN